MREIFVANTDEIEDRERVVIVDGSLEIGVFRLGDDFFAWDFHNRSPRGCIATQGGARTGISGDRRRSNAFR